MQYIMYIITTVLCIVYVYNKSSICRNHNHHHNNDNNNISNSYSYSNSKNTNNYGTKKTLNIIK